MRLGDAERALVLAGRSLALGCAIEDRFGQTITLDLLIRIWQGEQKVEPLLAAMVLYRDLARTIGDEEAAAQFEPVLEQVRELPDEAWSELKKEAQGVVDVALAEAEQKFEGGDPLQLR